MEAMRKSWTDDRLDDFSGQVWRRFDEVDRRFDDVNGRLDRIEGRLERIDSRISEQFGRLDARIDQLSQTMFRTMAGLIVTMALGFASLLVAGS
jgi:tetrahydromethanopterin S-methyltransferase subunit G